jgi:YkoY family integral membrane protein
MHVSLPFGQDFSWSDLPLIGFLVVLEGVLSIDNALVLGMLAKRLPKDQRSRALTYGLVGAFAFRFIAIGMASLLMKWKVVKLLGGGYLLYISVKHLWFERSEQHEAEVAVSSEGEPVLVDEATGQPLTSEQEAAEIEQRVPVPMAEDLTLAGAAKGVARFWPTVVVIELTDIAFAVDSILAAIGVVRQEVSAAGVNSKLWVVVAGGVLGVVMMRFAAVIFIRLLERFPRFGTAAYLLVMTIGVKLLAEWWFNSQEHPHVVDFHSWKKPEFWLFWGTMAACFLSGFLSKPEHRPQEQAKGK